MRGKNADMSHTIHDSIVCFFSLSIAPSRFRMTFQKPLEVRHSPQMDLRFRSDHVVAPGPCHRRAVVTSRSL
jgi:hypothetical protein